MDKERVLLDSEDRMDKALGALDRDFSRLRTGRASTGRPCPAGRSRSRPCRRHARRLSWMSHRPMMFFR